MTEIPEDIMKAATETAASWYHEEWEPEEYICKLLVEYIATALLAERKRCVEIARTWDDDPYVGSAIAEAIMEGGEA